MEPGYKQQDQPTGKLPPVTSVYCKDPKPLTVPTGEQELTYGGSQGRLLLKSSTINSRSGVLGSTRTDLGVLRALGIAYT